MLNRTSLLILLFVLILKSAPAAAYEITDKFSISGILAGAYQYQFLGDSSPAYDDTGRGAVPIQAELSFIPTPSSEFFVKLGLTSAILVCP